MTEFYVSRRRKDTWRMSWKVRFSVGWWTWLKESRQESLTKVGVVKKYSFTLSLILF